MKTISQKITKTVSNLENKAVSLLQNLVQIPSENFPPTGNEKKVQEFYHNWLNEHGLESKLYYPDDVPGFSSHPARLPERDMRNRPNVVATLQGSGAGRSLLLMAHADVVPAGNPALWDDHPFSGKISSGRLYGRGSGDDKCGMAIMAMVPLVLKAADIELAGNLTIASVVDEEAGGGNGTAALLASEPQADAAVYLDGSNQTIWDTSLGGGIVDVIVEADSTAALTQSVSSLEKTILKIKKEREKAIVEHHDFGEKFFDCEMEGFYNIEKIKLNELRTKLTFLFDTLPGDDENALKQRAEQELKLNGKISVSWMSRFLTPTPKIARATPLISELSKSFLEATGRRVVLAPGRQSDQGLVNYYGHLPCVIFGCGRRGKDGAPHLPNEYILLKEFKENLLTAALMAINWCA